MSRCVRRVTVDAEGLALMQAPFHTVAVDEIASAEGRFTAQSSVFARYERTVVAEPCGPDRWRVRQQVDFVLAIPYFGWLFRPLFRLELRRIRPRPSGGPFWLPPDRLDERAVRSLALLAAFSVVAGYGAALLTETLTYSAAQFHAGAGSQGVALAAVRADAFITIPFLLVVERRGRRFGLVVATALGCLATAVGALAPSLAFLVATQIVGHGFLVAAVVVLVPVMAAEEMPAGGRAYAISILAMAYALGAGIGVVLLPVAGASAGGWRVLFGLALLGLPLLPRMFRLLPESRRFEVRNTDARMAGHGGRFWLLAAAGLLINLFAAPASQFQNEYLRVERHYSAVAISTFTVATSLPGLLGIVIGGRLAEIRGRRRVGAVAIVGGVLGTVLMYLTTGFSLWLWSAVGSALAAAYVPALGVYGPELFPTAQRGKANGLLTGLSRAGSVAGLIICGALANRFHRFGPALVLLAVGPAITAVLVLAKFPETAHRQLEELNPEDARPNNGVPAPGSPRGDPPGGGDSAGGPPGVSPSD